MHFYSILIRFNYEKEKHEELNYFNVHPSETGSAFIVSISGKSRVKIDYKIYMLTQYRRHLNYLDIAAAHSLRDHITSC